MKVIIVGAGMGGLACAIACRREGLDVVLCERAEAFAPIGAGIQIPPNAALVAKKLGYLGKLSATAVEVDGIDLRRYSDGRLLLSRPCGKQAVLEFGSPWLVIHRADYHEVLYQTAVEIGVEVRLGASLASVDFEKSVIHLQNGDALQGDVIVGADGLWSTVRDLLLDKPSPPEETGDLAYRGTFSKRQLLDLHDPTVTDLCSRLRVSTWLGPGRHSVFYPLKGGEQFNLVLIRPDNIPTGFRTERGDIAEMRASYEGWDPTLSKIISCVSSVLKWKLCHHEELRTWTKGTTALLGDACHPTLPYQAQGAAMAIEDGAVLGRLLGLLQAEQGDRAGSRDNIIKTLQIYETVRKERTTQNVAGARANRVMFHLDDGAMQQKRDSVLEATDWAKPTSKEWKWLDQDYQMTILGFDAVADAESAFARQSRPT